MTTSTPFGEFDWDELLDEPHRATASIALCFKAHLNAQHAALEADLVKAVEAKRKTGDKDRSDLKALADQVKAIEAEMMAATHVIELQAMRSPDFRALRDKYPPRKDNDLDKSYGVNTETIWPELLAETATTPKKDREWWTRLIGEVLNGGQADRLAVSAWNVNGLDVAVPFSQLASLMSLSTGEELRQRIRSESAAGGSTAGRRARSSGTSSTKKANG